MPLTYIPEIILLILLSLQVISLSIFRSHLVSAAEKVLIMLFWSAALTAHLMVWSIGAEDLFGGALRSDSFFRLGRATLVFAALMLGRFMTKSLGLSESRKREGLLLLNMALIFGCALVLSQNLLVSFLSLLGLGLVSLLLCGMNFTDAEEGEAFFKYWAQFSLGTVIGFASLFILVLFAGALEYKTLAAYVLSLQSAGQFPVVLLVILPFWVIAGYFPFHFVVLDRDHGAPWSTQTIYTSLVSPVAAMGLLRTTVLLFGKSALALEFVVYFALIAAFGLILAGSTQRNTKRLLAFFSAAYIAVGFSLLLRTDAFSLAAVMFWICAAQLAFVLVFPVLGAFQELSASEDRTAVFGIGRHHRLAGTILLGGLCSLLLFPVFPGFHAFFHAMASLFGQQSLFRILAFVVWQLLSTLVVLRLITDLFFRDPSEAFLTRWPRAGADFLRYGLGDRMLQFAALIFVVGFGLFSDHIFAALVEAANAFII